MQTVKQSAMALFLAVITFTASAHPHSFIASKPSWSPTARS
jgi:ABC-type uncharacterized transport system substrate-binding protein